MCENENDHVEVDQSQGEIDADSSYGEGASTASTSLHSSVLRYEFKHGRRYHSYQAGAYNGSAATASLKYLRYISGLLWVTKILPVRYRASAFLGS